MQYPREFLEYLLYALRQGFITLAEIIVLGVDELTAQRLHLQG